MTTPEEFLEWLGTLPSARVPLHDPGNPVPRTIDLATLAKDIRQHGDFAAWWKSKNMPKHLNNTVAMTIIEQDPPEDIKAAMLFLML